MGITGVTSKEKTRKNLGLQVMTDDLDAFRHAFMSAVFVAWDEFLGAHPLIAGNLSNFLGSFNEWFNMKKDGECSTAMDTYNNEKGRSWRLGHPQCLSGLFLVIIRIVKLLRLLQRL